ncbi:rhodanese-like domain-containing protein [Tenacibaculum pacificus]|uniref:rhodanese-like domain-containing protein n=1 Tax=Tenacibaculum pacificus TaxID=3018314 RepID=UPI002FDE0878
MKKHNTETIPYISVDSLSNLIHQKKEFVLLDARESKEFKVSHLKSSVCVGYDNFDIYKILKKLPSDKKTKIVVYCSLGIRSEDIAEKLKKEGYTNIYNLYGGIFEWKNKQNLIVNSDNNPTEKVHTFNKAWSKWLLKGEKIYE